MLQSRGTRQFDVLYLWANGWHPGGSMQVNSRGHQIPLVEGSVVSPQIGSYESSRECKQHFSGLTLGPLLKQPDDRKGEISQERVSSLLPDCDTNSHLRTKNPQTLFSRPSGQTDDPPLPVPTGEKHQCGLCDKRYTKRSALLRHHRSKHMVEMPYKCAYCDRRYGRSDALKMHQQIVHTNENVHKCSYCERCFARNCDLKKHLRVHTGEQPYKCCQCDKRFSLRGNLKKHLRVHTGDRPYRCNQCTSTFAELCTMKRHLLIHSGEKPFQCTHCDRRFTRKKTLDLHLDSRHRDMEPHERYRCLKVFAGSKNLISDFVNTHPAI